MARDEHTPFIETIPAYAIGALDADEAAALESHLETCASCRTELAEYRSLSESLLTAVPPRQPSAALRKRLQGRLPSARKAARSQRIWSVGRLAMVLGVIVLLALNLLSFLQLQQIRSQQASLLNQVQDAQTALGMLSSSDVRILTIREATISGTLLLDENQAVLILDDLPALTANQVYQMWWIEPNGERTSAGLFRPESEQAYTTQVISPPQMISDFVGLGVTVEPAGGSDQPTGERIFKVDF